MCAPAAALLTRLCPVLHDDAAWRLGLVAQRLGAAAARKRQRVLVGRRRRAAVLALPLQRLQHAEAVQRQLRNLDLQGRPVRTAASSRRQQTVARAVSNAVLRLLQQRSCCCLCCCCLQPRSLLPAASLLLLLVCASQHGSSQQHMHICMPGDSRAVLAPPIIASPGAGSRTRAPRRAAASCAAAP